MKVLIIGFKGRVAQRHIKAWEELGVEWIGRTHEDTNSIDYDDIDIVDICTPIYLHHAMISEAVYNNTPVICEKPISSEITDDLLEDILMWDLNGDKVCIVYQFRYNPKIIKLKKEIEQGKYGEIKLVTSHYYRYRDPSYYGKWEGDKYKAGGGVVLNVTIHYLDLMQWMFGYPTKIEGMKTLAKQGLDIEDTAVAIMQFPSGAIGNFIATTHANPPKHYELSVYGTKGHTTIQLRENEYHKDNFLAFINNKDYVTPLEALKSLRMVKEIIK